MSIVAQLQAQVAQLTNALRTLRGQVKSLAVAQALRTKRVAVSIGPVPIGTVDVQVPWPVPFPDDNYFVAVEIISGAAGIGTLHAQLKVTSRTPESCEITVTAAAAVAVVVLDVLGVRP